MANRNALGTPGRTAGEQHILQIGINDVPLTRRKQRFINIAGRRHFRGDAWQLPRRIRPYRRFARISQQKRRMQRIQNQPDTLLRHLHINDGIEAPGLQHAEHRRDSHRAFVHAQRNGNARRELPRQISADAFRRIVQLPPRQARFFALKRRRIRFFCRPSIQPWQHTAHHASFRQLFTSARIASALLKFSGSTSPASMRTS